MKRFMLTIFMFLGVTSFAQSQINFVWDPHPEAAQITGFRLYQSKTSGSYTTTPVAAFGGGTTTSGSIAKPTTFGRYYYVLSAIATDTTITPNVIIESDFSNEVTVVVKPKPPRIVSATQIALMFPVKGAKKIAEWAGLTEHKNLRVK